MGEFLAALSFLSIVPVSPKSYTETDFHNCQKYFVAVGLVIGGLCATVGWLVLQVLPVLPAAVLGMVLLIVFSGGIHLDGLADSADGLLSHRPRERILEIMKDSRIGTFGTVALIALLLIKSVCLYQLGGDMWLGLLLAPICGRSVILLQKKFIPCARPGGMGEVIGGGVGTSHAALAILLPLVAGLLLYGGSGVIGAILALAVCGIGFPTFVQGKIGGYTGDTLGASSEIAEACCLVGMCLHLQ